MSWACTILPPLSVATAILYCHPARRGGHTTFTRGALKVVPRPGDLLLFVYKLPDGRADGGLTEHSGCPVRAGRRKWIATQWFREGISLDEPWHRWEAAWQG